MKLFLMITILINLSLLSACSTLNDNFDCPNQAGIYCKSLGEINDMVDRGQIGGHRKNCKTKLPCTVDCGEFQAFPQMTSYSPGDPIRYGETIQRIWFAPYEDTEGNYHQDNLMYSVVKGGHWIGNPVKA